MAVPKDVQILGKDGAWHSIKGPPGKDGQAVNIKGSVATKADLTAKEVTAKLGDGWITDNDGHLHVWTGPPPPHWTDVEWKGDKGDTGDPGRYTHTFDDPTPPAAASKPRDPTVEPDKPHAGDIWFQP